jgi:hypothetical protein
MYPYLKDTFPWVSKRPLVKRQGAAKQGTEFAGAEFTLLVVITALP